MSYPALERQRGHCFGTVAVISRRMCARQLYCELGDGASENTAAIRRWWGYMGGSCSGKGGLDGARMEGQGSARLSSVRRGTSGQGVITLWKNDLSNRINVLVNVVGSPSTPKSQIL